MASILHSSVLWGISLSIITELLSYFDIFSFKWVLLSWSVLCLITFAAYFIIEKKTSLKLTIKKDFPYFFPLCVVFIISVVGVIALIAPPDTFDSMTYHMARVSHWIQNGNVFFYPTSILRQLYMPPWAEFAIAHFQILSGTDRFANIVQWFAMAGSILGISLITAQLGASLKGQIFSAVFCSTIPMGILQGSSTQTDYVVTFWIVCLIYYILLYYSEPKISVMLWAGMSLGLAILTKGTAYFYAFPFIIWFCFLSIKFFRWNFWKPIALIVALVISINLGHYMRNYNLFGTPIVSGEAPYELTHIKCYRR